MSNLDMTSAKGNVKTLAIRLEPDLHAQLSVIAQLSGTNITDEIREAIASHIERKRSAPELAGKASAVLEDIERDAAVRRDAIAALFGSPDPVPTEEVIAGPPELELVSEAPKGRTRRTTKETPDSTS